MSYDHQTFSRLHERLSRGWVPGELSRLLFPMEGNRRSAVISSFSTLKLRTSRNMEHYYGTLTTGVFISLPKAEALDYIGSEHWIIIKTSEPFSPAINLSNAPPFEILHFPSRRSQYDEVSFRGWLKWRDILASHPQNISSERFGIPVELDGELPKVQPTSRREKNTFSAFIRKTTNTG